METIHRAIERASLAKSSVLFPSPSAVVNTYRWFSLRLQLGSWRQDRNRWKRRTARSPQGLILYTVPAPPNPP